jgi:hypothetical protein
MKRHGGVFHLIWPNAVLMPMLMLTVSHSLESLWKFSVAHIVDVVECSTFFKRRLALQAKVDNFSLSSLSLSSSNLK